MLAPKRITDALKDALLNWADKVWYELQGGGQFLLPVAELKPSLNESEIEECEQAAKMVQIPQLRASSGDEYP